VNHDQSPAGQHERYALGAERIIDAPPEAIFDAFIALYDSERPDWVTGSRLDLRPGGRWSVAFQVPDGPAFREERVITAVERPHRLAYDMTAVYADAPGFSTTVEVTIDAVPDGQRLRLVQQGFPTVQARDDFAGAWPDVLGEVGRRVMSRRP
jgi:uncharacterized protein YndB with AHSA1/START domain